MDGSQESFSRRIIRNPAAQILAAALACSAAGYLAAKEDTTPTPAHSSAAQELSRPTFNLHNYTPPPEGIVIGTAHFDPSNTGTVVLLPDLHTMAGAQDGTQVQTELFRIVQDLITKYGRIPIVQEGMVDIPADTLMDQKIADALPAEAQIAHGQKLLAPIYWKKDEAERVSNVEQLLGDPELPAFQMLLAAYKDKIEIIGATTHIEAVITLGVHDSVIHASHIIEHAGDYQCSAKSPHTFAEAVNYFRGEVRKNTALSKELLRCYCAMRNGIQAIHTEFIKDRKKSAQREAEAAVPQAQQHGITVVIAGSNHLPTALNVLKSKPVNYVVVSPFSIRNDVDATIQNGPSWGQTGLDDKKGECAPFDKALLKQVREAEARLQREMMKWMETDD